jgi:PAT family beta-lactamase induction signal transducer AmpG
MRIPQPDLLASRKGRLAAFFLLYVTEGIPLGFTATAIAAQMRRQELGPAAIGAFVGSLYLPWAFKWAVGPFVDVFSSDRFGRRRTWIFLMQLGMCATLLVAMGVDFVHQLALFTAIIFLHNAFGATQDVAIDALAVSALPEEERGSANGFMFAGASIGQTIGGSGVLFLTGMKIPFPSTYIFVVACIFAITAFVVLPLREKAMSVAEAQARKASSVGRELAKFVREAWVAFTGSRAALVGVFAALLPAGAYALSQRCSRTWRSSSASTTTRSHSSTSSAPSSSRRSASSAAGCRTASADARRSPSSPSSPSCRRSGSPG